MSLTHLIVLTFHLSLSHIFSSNHLPSWWYRLDPSLLTSSLSHLILLSCLSLFISSFSSSLILPIYNFHFLVCLLHPSPLTLYAPDCYFLSPVCFCSLCILNICLSHTSHSLFFLFFSLLLIPLHILTCMSCHFTSLLCFLSSFFLAITSFLVWAIVWRQQWNSGKFDCLCFICVQMHFLFSFLFLFLKMASFHFI